MAANSQTVHRMRLWYWHQRARIELWWGFNVMNFLYFLRVAWGFLCGRLLIITTEKRVTNGGYKCIAIVISKRPVSSSHSYEDL